MFVESIRAPRDEWERWTEKLRLLTEPPDALVAAIAWMDADGQVTSVNVWDTPDAVADFYMQRVRAIIEVEGEQDNKPQRHGPPLAVYIRR